MVSFRPFFLVGKRALEEAVAAPPTKKTKGEKKVVPPPKKVESSSEEESDSEEEVCIMMRSFRRVMMLIKPLLSPIHVCEFLLTQFCGLCRLPSLLPRLSRLPLPRPLQLRSQSWKKAVMRRILMRTLMRYAVDEKATYTYFSYCCAL